jgi:hypothetical protein
MPHIHYALLYARATSDAYRRKIVGDALNELRSIRYAKKGGHRDTREGRLLVGRDPRPIGTVAYVFGYTKRHVYRLRAEAKEHDARVRPVGRNAIIAGQGLSAPAPLTRPGADTRSEPDA